MVFEEIRLAMNIKRLSDTWELTVYPLSHIQWKLSYLKSFRTSLVAQWFQNPPANAGDTGSIPGPGRSHMPRRHEARGPQLLSPRATTTESMCHNY